MIYIFIGILFLVLQSMQALAAAGTPNVGTVLFTRADADKKTWSNHNLALLKARLYFQHLVPPFVSPQSKDYVESLLKYIKDGYVSISQESKDIETDKILTSAFTDVIGGYLKMYVLPVTKYAYYGGTLGKQDAIKLFLFYDDLKRHLGTNGTGWAAPDMSVLRAVTVEVAVPPAAQARSMSDPDSCRYVTYYEKTPSGLSIPMPVIDWPSQTMFMPFSKQPVINLQSPDDSDALHNYYLTATNCIHSSMPYEFENFDQRFQKWLQDAVVPHLNDDPLYAALQGVFALLNTTSDPQAIGSYNDVLTKLAVQPKVKVYQLSTTQPMFTRKRIILIIVALEIFCCVPTILYVLCQTKKKCKAYGRSSSSCVNTILESRRVKSDSDYSSRSHSSKRHGGLKFHKKPYSSMEVGEVYSAHSLRSINKETLQVGQRVSRHAENEATVIDEVAALKRQRSSKLQTTGNPDDKVSRTQTSDDSTKTFTLSTVHDSRATTVKISSRVKESTEGRTAITPKNSRRSLSSKSTKKEVSEERSTTEVGKTSHHTSHISDLLISEICYDNTILMQPTPVARPSEQQVKEYEKKVKAVERSSEFLGFRVQTEDKTYKIQGAEVPYLEIHIGRPQQATSVDSSAQEEERRQTEPHVHISARGSRIPKRAPGSRIAQIKVTSFKHSSTESRQHAVIYPKSKIPKLKRTVDDSALQTKRGSKTSKLNVTL